MVHHAPLGMARLPPWIGVQKINDVKARIGQTLDHGESIAHMQPHILQLAIPNVAERPDHPVQEWLAPDKANVRCGQRLPGEMFPSAEADFKPQWAIVVEQPCRIERAIFRHFHPWKQFFDKRGLPLAQLMPLATTVETTDGGWIVHPGADNGANERSKAPSASLRVTIMGKGKKAKAAAKAEHRMVGKAAELRTKAPIAVLGAATEVADQPPLVALSIATLATGLVLRQRHLARTGARMLLAHGLATGGKTLLKRAIDRSRPARALKDGSHRMESGSGGGNGDFNSFPSGHTAGAVSVAEAVSHTQPGMATAARTGATAVAVLQIPRGKHYPSDVLAGAIIGFVADRIAGMIVDRTEHLLARQKRPEDNAALAETEAHPS